LKPIQQVVRVCIFIITFLFANSIFAQTNYNTYYGNLHAHSAYSDGNKENANATPTDNYTYAHTALCFDFLGISEHNHFSSTNNPGMLLPLYAQGLQQAQAYTNAHPGFVALFGMEWGVISNGGHVVIYGIDSLIGWETLSTGNNYDIYVAKSDYQGTNGLFQKIVDRKNSNAFATLAHPNSSDYGNMLYGTYSAIADSAVVGVAVESGPAFSTDTTYSDAPSDMSFLSYYMQALAKGYHVGPTIDHDNHYMTFGKTNTSRLAILATQLNKSALLDAMRKRRFFATQDCDTKISLSIQQQVMGSSTSGTIAPTITISASDPSSASAVPSITIMKGEPGSNQLATALKTITAFNATVTDTSLLSGKEAYYYLDVVINGKRSISAPIWYTRTVATNTVANLAPMDWDLEVKNPIINTLQLQWSLRASENFDIQIRSLLGHTLYHKRHFITPSNPTTEIPLDLAPGMYLLSISTPQGARTFRVLKQ
jgi:trimeric autotransporter adhesin